tara:strand:+ start:1047 stop:1274 length:228 start_codon:yes stop_codon:yes gene_type:complete
MEKEEFDKYLAELNKGNNLAALNNDVILENGMSMQQIYANPDLWYMLEQPEEEKPAQSTADKMRALARKRKNNGR